MRLSRKDYVKFADICGKLYAQAILMGRCVNTGESPREMTPEKSDEMKAIMMDLCILMSQGNNAFDSDKFLDELYEAMHSQWTERKVK